MTKLLFYLRLDQ